MPLVRAYVAIDPMDTSLKYLKSVDALIGKLFCACREIVPAAFNSPQGQLTPGSIEFIPQTTPGQGMNVDVLLDIEAFDYNDRAANIDDRAEDIREALCDLFLGQSFAIWAKLVKAGWASDGTDPSFSGDMSMEAAINRAYQALWFGESRPKR
jgi:hypothetical protein